MYYNIFVGLDVHKDTITIATARGYDEEKHHSTIAHDYDRLGKILKKLDRPENVKVVYEAGPCGYGIYRHLKKLGIECFIAAPSLIPKRPGDRVKTDKRDAKTLVKLFRSQELSMVFVPDQESEAFRELVRAREAAVSDKTRAQQRIKKFLLRNNIHPPQGKRPWTVTYRNWLSSLTFKLEAQHMVFKEFLQAFEETRLRVERLDTLLEKQAPQSNQSDFIAALRGMRGIDTVTAATIASELIDPLRFEHPRKLMSYMGIVPSEYSSGHRKSQGSITKAGNAHLRRVVIEAAWNYNKQPSIGYRLRKRQEGLSAELKDIAWRAQMRLSSRFGRLLARGKPKPKVVVAVARELLAFIWELGQQVAKERQQKEQDVA